MAVLFTPSQALQLWRHVVVDTVRSDSPDLSARQFAILLTVYLAPPPHTVRDLALTLSISKPAITRALDKLCELHFLRRKKDEEDRRNVLVQRTVKGSVFLSELADRIYVAEGEIRVEGENRAVGECVGWPG